MVHDGLAKLVLKEMHRLMYRNVEGVAQAVINTVKETHKRKQQSGRIDDITLLIYNLGHPLGPETPNLDHTDSPSYAPLPYDSQLSKHGQAPHVFDRAAEGYFIPNSEGIPTHPLQWPPAATTKTPERFGPAPMPVSAGPYPVGYSGQQEIPYNQPHSHPPNRPPVSRIPHSQHEGFYEGASPFELDFGPPEPVTNVPTPGQDAQGSTTTTKDKDAEKMPVAEKPRVFVPEPSPRKQDKSDLQDEPEPPAKEEHMIPCHVVFPSHLMDKTLDDF